MDRRSFLRGLVVSAIGSELVVRASPQEIELFGKSAPVSVAADFPISNLQPGQLVFNHEGRVLGILTEVVMSHEPIEFHSTYDHEQKFIRGPVRVEFRGVMTGVAQTFVK